MAVSYKLGNTPFWFFTDETGKALVGGYLWSLNANNPALLKPIYADPNGLNPYPNPMPIDSNGFVVTKNNLYFADDAPYLLQVTDSPTQGLGTILYQSDAYNAAGAGGGGGTTTYINIDNLITNGQFLFNISPNSPKNITTALTTIAPSNHNGLTTPDIVLRKNSAVSTESINFIQFNQGDTLPASPNQTPRFYLEYACTVIGAETQKDIEFPISAHVRTLETQIVTLSFWGRSSTSSTVEAFVTQYFGDGNNAPSAPASSTPQSVALTPTWVKYTVTITVPTTSGKTIGNCFNDYLVAAIRAPLGQLFNIDITNVMLINGAVTSDYPYNTQDQTSAILYAPRTGDVKLAFDQSITVASNLAAFGWLMMNDGTIGSPTSAATSRANIDTFPLYNYLWTNVSQPSANTYCPVVGGIGGSAAADFTANKPLTLSLALGRALAGAGTGAGLTNRPLGSFFGEENHLLTTAELPPLSYAGSNVTIHTASLAVSPGAFPVYTPQATANTSSQSLNVVTNAGNGSHNTMQPTTFMNVYIKL